MENYEQYTEEAQIGDNPDSLNSEQLKQALFQMENCVCKITIDNIIGTGFFCKIPFPNSFNLLPVLITCNHVLDENNISQGKIIKFSMNNENYSYCLIIDESRKTYTNKEGDFTIIEIKPDEDKIKFESFLDIDENIFKDNPRDIYKNKSIYIIHYEKGQKVKYSVGKIKDINMENSNIYHYCTTYSGSSGGPILSLFNYKVIGVHKGNKNKVKNLGTFIKFAIEKFNESNSSKNLKIKKNNLYPKGFNEIKEGLILNGICNNKKCKKEVFYNFGFGTFDYINDLTAKSKKCPKCPMCGCLLQEFKSLGFFNCKYEIRGKKFDNGLIKDINYSKESEGYTTLDYSYYKKGVWVELEIYISNL